MPKTVLVFGVFDLLHPGHHHFLRAAKSFGSRLVVVVTRDERVEKEKGRRSVNSLERRLEMLSELDFVDDALPGDRTGEWGMVRRISPDVICIGHDQREDHPYFLSQLEGLEPRPQIIKLQPFERERYSTSRIRQELINE